MAVAMAHTVALRGAVGHLIDVQADVSAGQVGLTLVGRVDAALSEGRDRVRMAIVNSSLDWPATRRITVLLSPADLPKAGTHYDLALALAILAAAGEIDPSRSRASRSSASWASTVVYARRQACCRWCSRLRGGGSAL